MIKEFSGKYRWLSNFTRCRIIYKGIVYSSVEHAYMSAKSDDEAWKQFCADAKNTPGKVKRKSRKLLLRKDWEGEKINVMRELLEQKFTKEPFKSLLINTEKTYIQEGNTWGDEYWGVNLENGNGENKLGQMIMNIRDKIKANETLVEKIIRPAIVFGYRFFPNKLFVFFTSEHKPENRDTPG